MKATIDGVLLEGTVEEIVEYRRCTEQKIICGQQPFVGGISIQRPPKDITHPILLENDFFHTELSQDKDYWIWEDKERDEKIICETRGCGNWHYELFGSNGQLELYCDRATINGIDTKLFQQLIDAAGIKKTIKF